jgi:hypothetical protein
MDHDIVHEKPFVIPLIPATKFKLYLSKEAQSKIDATGNPVH